MSPCRFRLPQLWMTRSCGLRTKFFLNKMDGVFHGANSGQLVFGSLKLELVLYAYCDFKNGKRIQAEIFYIGGGIGNRFLLNAGYLADRILNPGANFLNFHKFRSSSCMYCTAISPWVYFVKAIAVSYYINIS